MNWEQMIAIEPGLKALLDHIETIKDDGSAPSFCANHQWYGKDQDGRSLKRWMSDLVGWGAFLRELRTEEAYNIAYDKLYGALPDCRNCICF